jgi:hypothetical protein
MLYRQPPITTGSKSDERLTADVHRCTIEPLPLAGWYQVSCSCGWSDHHPRPGLALADEAAIKHGAHR